MNSFHYPIQYPSISPPYPPTENEPSLDIHHLIDYIITMNMNHIPFIKTLINDRADAYAELARRHYGQKAMLELCANMMSVCNLIGQILCSSNKCTKLIRQTAEQLANSVAEGFSGGNDFFNVVSLEHVLATLDPNSLKLLMDKPADDIIMNSQFPSPSFYTSDKGDVLVENPDGNFFLNGEELKPLNLK